MITPRSLLRLKRSEKAAPLRERVWETAAALIAAASVSIEHIAKSYIRKEDVLPKVLAARGRTPAWCS